MIEFFKSELLERSGFPVHGFTKRSGGVSKGRFSSLNLAYNVGDDPECVAENLKRLKSTLEVDVPLARVDQVHGSNVADAAELITNDSQSWIEPPKLQADGIVGKGTRAVLAVQNADCAPVLLADPKTKTAAALHAGWRGTARGVILSGVRAMMGKGASQKNIIAAVGPCACQNCYEVRQDVARRFPESSDPIKDKPGKFLMDLGLAVEVSLLGAGIMGKNIERIDACSICLESELFSVRRDGEPTGRFLGFIAV
ncbi:MAG: peptidoglycan editing factor PgeF [Proteobacteria bacterium]|nr:peptidoglycan editing factor PgeF [Pseudomonadota bacterium]